MSGILNAVKFLSSTTSNGSTIAIGAAYSNATLTPSAAGAVDGKAYKWRVDDETDFMIVKATYNNGAQTLTINQVIISNIGGTTGTTQLTLDGNEIVSLIAEASDLAWLDFAEASIASASTVDLSTVTNSRVAITGTTTITSLGTGTYLLKLLRFTGVLTLTYNATSLITPALKSVTTGAGDTALVGSDGSGNWTVLNYWSQGGAVLPGYINGLTLSNDSGTPNTKVDVAVGAASDSTNAVLMTLKSSGVVDFTASGANGLDTGSQAASTWYAILLISGPSGTVVMATKETAGSAISPTMPSGYTYYRYIGSVFSNSSTHIATFAQMGQTFYLAAQVKNVNNSTASSATLFTATVPLGINVYPIVGAGGDQGAIWSPSMTSTIPTPGNIGIGNDNGTIGGVYLSNMMSNTSGQLYYADTDDNTGISIWTIGWIDPHVSPVF